ncbi:hypothetical protein [uncultured Dialister sp.]|uniref:hypothetical protein n=1 Tax=uncultured Dialister sp. TaxID=278064 RepID=UPI0026DBB0F5|nr:hypothetical protein [uncultured Dialister sp.]
MDYEERLQNGSLLLSRKAVVGAFKIVEGASLYKTFTTAPLARGNAPLLPPAAASPPEGEILAALCNERLKLAQG